LDTFECIRSRLEVKEFRGGRVPEEVVAKILEAGRLSPSAMNLQPWVFIVVRGRDKLKRLGELATTGRYIQDSDFVVVVVTDPENPYHKIDGARAVQNMMLAAWNEGVGSRWVGGIKREEVKQYLNIPQDMYVLTIIPFGYPARKICGRKRRKSLREIAFSEVFGGPLTAVKV